MNESSTLMPNIKDFLDRNNTCFENLENIVIVSWPWSFTWVRTTTLVANTISYLNKDTKITDITYFDLFDLYPIIKKSSRRDSFVKLSKEGDIKVILNTELADYIKGEYVWDKIDLLEFDNFSKPNYEELIKNLTLLQKDIISPFYFKKPNIT